MVVPSFSKRRILNFLGLALIVYLAVIVFQTVKHNYELNTQINALQNQISDLTIQQSQLQYDLRYYQTNSFKEKSARSNLGLMQPGEGVIVLPKTSAPATSVEVKKTGSKPKSNPAQWWQFLFG